MNETAAAAREFPVSPQGGLRHWFTCPQCGKRVAVLYAPGRYFACRRCGGLGYPTQKEGAGDRAANRADRIPKRLRWEAGILNGDAGKPKGMHWRTLCRLKAEHDAFVGIALTGIARRFGLVERGLARAGELLRHTR